MHSKILGHAAQLIESGSSDCHGFFSLLSLPAWLGLGGNSNKLSDKAGIAEIARVNLPRDLAFLNNQNPLRHCGDEIQVLLAKDQGQAAGVAKPLQRIDDLLDDRGLDAFRRLVEQHETRLA